MKKCLIFLVSLFLMIGTMWAQTFPETSTADAPKYYTIASYNRGGYLTNVGEGRGVEHIAATKESLWYFTQADENGGVHFCNYAGGYLAADKTVSETAGVWYVLSNGVNTNGVSISSTNPISNGSCIDANNNSGVGTWHPSANDWEGTTWVFAEVTDFSTIFNVDGAKASAKAEIDVLASVSGNYSDATAAKERIDNIDAEGTSPEQYEAAIATVNQCVADYKDAVLQALGGKYFTINTPARDNGFMKVVGNRVVGVAEASSSAAIWQFECADGVVKVFNPYTGKYLCEPGAISANVAVTENAAEAGAYQLVVNQAAANDAAKVKLTSNGKSIHMAENSVLVRWDNGGASEWTIAEVEVDITKDIVELLEANADNHAETPTLGQYSTAGYTALQDALNTVTTLKQAADAVAAFEATKCLPVFNNFIKVNAGTDGWIEGTEWFDESAAILSYTSPLYHFQDKVEAFRITVNKSQTGGAFFCLSELTLYDGNGEKIALTADNIASNADHNTLNPNSLDGGGLVALLDGQTGTFFHSAWMNMPAEAHYLEITLPNGGYDAFCFRMLSRAFNRGSQTHTFPGEMVVATSVALESTETPNIPEGGYNEPIEGVVSNLSETNPAKCYTISTNGRGAWAVDAEAVRLSYVPDGNIDATDSRQQFAILSVNDEDYYLYSVSEKMFVKSDGSLDLLTGDAIEFVDASASQGTGRVQVHFRDFANSYINVNTGQGLIINHWNTIDEGNAVLIAEAGDFDAAEALAILADPEAAALAALVAQVQAIIDANADNHAVEPALGQYLTEAYEALVAVVNAEDKTSSSLRDAVAAFEATKCLPVFTIDGVWGYALGMSIYESESGSLLWKETDRTESMLWSFDMTDTIVGVTDKVVVRNLATGNLFWGASFIKVTETSEAVADDGLFLFYTEGTGNPVHADQVGQSIVRWNNLSANSASAWRFTYAGTTYGINDLPEVPDTPVVPDTPEGVVNNLASADPAKCYSITTMGRGGWTVDAAGTSFTCTTAEGLTVDESDSRQQFAILSANDEDYYLYSVSAKKFVQKDGSLVPFVGDAIELIDASSIGAGRVMVRFDAEHIINVSDASRRMEINNWSTLDAGNAVVILEADDFDATDALAILADPEGAKLAVLISQAQELLAANADNHAAEPALGQYATSAYEDLEVTVNSDSVSVAALEYFIAAFEGSKCLPVFTIDGANDYAAGMSIYDDGGQYPRWKATDRSDESMLWAFEMTDTVVGVTDKVVVKNLATGNLFMGNPPYNASYLRVAETTEDIADDGLFLMFREEDTEYAIWASQTGMVVPSQGIFSANSTSAWRFTYAGTTYRINELPEEGTPQGVISSLSAADPTKRYTISTNGRGAWAVDDDGTRFSTTGVEEFGVDAADARQQFAILSTNAQDYYLYSVSAKKFVKRDRTLVSGPADAIELLDASSLGAGRVQVRFRDIADSYINIGGDNQMTINSWSMIDAGNAVLIAEAGDFDAAEALAMLADPEAAALAALMAQAQALIEANAENHAAEPALGQYATSAYDALVAAVSADEVDKESVEAAIAAFEASKCLPVFTIDGVYDYAAGMSIYESEAGTLLWRETDHTESMLWVFDMADTIVSVTDKVVVKNLATGNYFDKAFYIQITETEESLADDGLFLIYPEGMGYPLFADLNGRINRATNWSANSPCAWKFTYAGTTYGINKLPETPEEPDDDTEETISVDMTHMVGTSKAAWNATGGPVTIDGVSMPEHYLENTTTLGDVMWQTVTGLEDGKYTVELWANARYTPNRGFSSPAADGQQDLTYLFANKVELSIPVVYNAGLNNNASYVLEDVLVEGGTLRMGMMKKAPGSNWHTIQIKSLTYQGYDESDFVAFAKAELQEALAVAGAVTPTSEALTAAIASAQAVYDNATDRKEMEAAVAALRVATTLAVNTNAVAGATIETPVVTNFVVNGTFDANGVTAPWKTTTKAQNQATASNQQGAFTGNFFENWNPSAVAGKIYQEIEHVPNGLYELSICAFVNTLDATVQHVYANADKRALAAAAPTAYTVLTIVTDNKLEIGFEQSTPIANWMGIDNVSLKYYGEVTEGFAKSLYEATKAAADSLKKQKMSVAALQTLEAALAKDVDGLDDVALLAEEEALQEAMTTAQVSIDFFATNKAAIDAMFALMESTNVYTAEAYETYSAKAEDFLAQYEAGTLTATVDNPATVHGWRADVDYDVMLLSAFGAPESDWDNLHINTWSVEGETDGSEFKVPFFEYWTGDANSLGATTKTATLTGLTPDRLYSLEAWVRVRAKNGVAATDATGITLSVGEGESVDITEGDVIGTSQFSHGVYTAYGYADAEGKLTINFNVLDGNNVHWLSFKNLKYAESGDLHRYVADYESALANAEKALAKDIPSALRDELEATFETYSAVDNEDKATLIEAKKALDVVAAQVDEVVMPYAKCNDLIAVCEDNLNIPAEVETDLKTAFESAIASAVEGAEEALTAAELNEVWTVLRDAYFTYIANAVPAEGNMFDVTFHLQNPDFETNLDGWAPHYARYNTGEGYDGVAGFAEIGIWDYSAWDASISQTLTDLPNGKYVVKAAWMAEIGIQMTFAANEGRTIVTGIGDTGGNIANDGSVVEMGQGHRGWQYAQVEGLVEDSTLTITVSSSAQAWQMWSNADAFELYYLGKADESEEEPDVLTEQPKVTPSSDTPVTRVDNVILLFTKDVTATMPEGGIEVVNTETMESVKLASIYENPYLEKNMVMFEFEKKMIPGLDGTEELQSLYIDTPGNYSFTIPAGCIKSVDGEVFGEHTFTFTVVGSFPMESYSPMATDRLEKIEVTFNEEIVDVVIPNGGMMVVDSYWSESSKIKDEVTISDDKKTVTLELETPITTPGQYILDLYQGVFLSEDGINKYASLAFNVVDPTSGFITNYNDGDKVDEINALEITFNKVREVKLVEGAPSVVVYMPGGGEAYGTPVLADNKITVTFDQPLTDEGGYTFVIPEGLFTMDGVENEAREINVTVSVFDITPLEILSVTPAEGNVELLDKIIIKFNQKIQLSLDENWQQFSREIKMYDANGEVFTLTHNNDNYNTDYLEYIVGAQQDGTGYDSTPITAAGTYTLDISQIVVDYAAEESIDEWGYPTMIWHQEKQYCVGTYEWTIEPMSGDDDDDLSVYYMSPLPVRGKSSSVVNVPVMMENSGAVVSFQFDLYLPETVSVVSTMEDGEVIYDITLNSERAKSSHVLDCEPQADGALRVVAFSINDAPFEGNSGVILEVAAAIGDLEDGKYPIAVRNIRMAHADGTEEICPDFVANLTIQNRIMGDVNGDWSHTISDVVMVVNAALGRSQTNFDAVAADMNGDGMITVGDVVSVLRLVLGGDMAKASARSASRGEIVAPELDACEFSTIGEGRVVLPVALNNTEAYSAFQLDVVLPEGVELMEATLTDRARASHNMMWNTMADGRVRIVAYAMNNATFRGNEGVLLNLVFDTSNMQSGEDAIILSDALFAMANSAEHRAADLNVMMRSETTEINALQGGIRISGAEGAIVVETATAGEVSIYSLTGQMVQNISVSEGTNRIALPAGMYMVNRQKIIVK